MREVVALALAKHKGQLLTTEVAKEILRDLNSDHSVDPARFEPRRCGEYRLQCERLRDALADLAEQRGTYLAERFPLRVHSTDWLHLLDLAQSGALVIFTARDAAGALVGSMWLNLGRNADTGAMRLTDDLMYIDPAQRSGMLAARLWRYAEECTFALGVREGVVHLRMENGADRLARFAGYQPDALRFIKSHSGDNFADAPTRHKEKRRDPII
ncbi:hypothetical protein GCM10007320_08590 [Pseudorhodoferax aquiterrae]|uniref:N-acetyltransferase domain-containing protein n=1 Tax=Pseudorhodoferax aquiterrae TaxID=747304 RepID=A0ABQ3FWG6_9BURK|nr:hypothetical protein [Pseudorhodoferax aquiterrae]GHC72603.1 hypothetical protein GCM10007320_08590 [Pseudorhodoferax aquiterrae]